ncbi:hypothetical protein D3C87_888870 [compost metagenome]
MVRKLTSPTPNLPPAGPNRVAPTRIAPLGPVKPVPAEPAPARRPLTGEAAWMAELMFEAGFDPTLRGGQAETLAPHADPTGGFTRAQLLGGGSGPAPLAEGQLIRTPEQFRETLSYLFDPKRDAAVGNMEREAILRASREVWDPRKPETNRRIAYEFMRYFMPALGEAYGFKPAPVEFNTAMSAGFNGLYDHKAYKIYLPETLLQGPYATFVEILVHEQMHCLQEGMISRLYLNKGQPLSHEERAIATYWMNERPKYRSAMANGSQMSPETRKRYNAIGQEYHSITTGKHISERFSKS